MYQEKSKMTDHLVESHMKEIRGDAGFKRSPWDRDKNGRWDCNKFDSVQDADDADIDVQQCNGNLQDNLHCDECGRMELNIIFGNTLLSAHG